MSSHKDFEPGRRWPAAFLAILLLLVATAPLTAQAQGDQQIQDLDPLRPANTASPRDTLRSFLSNATEAIEERSGSENRQRNLLPYVRALQTLDLSTTPNGRTWKVRTERALFLKEILDRIVLPPEDEIPGVDDVAAGDITKWTIPDTRITISRVEEGPRAGQFLFSADTVERLDRLYRRAKYLPYKPGATRGAYDAWLSSDQTGAALGAQVRIRLRPVDTASPRSTLEGFLDSVNRAYSLVMETDRALASEPPSLTPAEAREIEATAANLLQRAISTLDLSQVPEALRADVGVETTLQLKEIIDRLILPPIETIPNGDMVAAARRGESGAFQTTDRPLRWRYPNTEIDIVEITEGPRKGQFLFSSESVERVGDFYQKIEDLPYAAT